MSSLITRILLALFFLSGFAGLIYEILWIKTFSFVLGNTVYTLSTVLAAYMAGLALGSYLIGRWTLRNRNPLLLFSGLQLGIGLACYVLHEIFQVHLKNLGAIGVLDPSQTGAILIRFLLSFALLLPPTFLMGGTLPVLSKFLARRRETLGKTIGMLYGFNTLGAACGSFVTGFFLIRLFGLNATNGIAVAMNGVVAAGGLVLAVLVPKQEDGPVERPSSPARTPGLPGRVRLLLILLMFSGFTAFSYEVVYARLASFLLGDRIFAATTMVTAFILGIGLGSLLIARWIDRDGKEWLWFSGLQALIGLSAAITMIFFSDYLAALSRFESRFVFGTPWHIVTFRFIQTLILIGLPAAAFGAIIPCVVKYISSVRGTVSMDVGLTYALNTVGCVSGALVTGFVFIPVFGTYDSMIGTALLSLLLSGIAIAIWACHRPVRIRAVFAAGWACAFAAVMLCSIHFKTYPWPREGKRLIFSEEDASALITVYEGPAGFYLYGGNSMLSFPIGRTTAESVQRFQAHLPLMLHPNPKDVLVIGLGFGVTSGAFTTYDAIESVESVELFPGVVNATPLFHAFNNDLARQPASTLYVADGRYFLKQTPKRYDIIVSNVCQSDVPGSAGCYTLEYFELARSRLKPDGIFLVHLFGAGGRMLFKTLREVYPFVEGFLGYRGTVFMAASQRTIRPDAVRIAEKLAAYPEFRADLEHGLVRNYEELAAHHVFDQNYVDRLHADPAIRLLTDDHPILEYALQSSGPDMYRSAFE